LKLKPLEQVRGVHEVTTVVVVAVDTVDAPVLPLQRHLNGQFPLMKSEPSHGTFGQTAALSGTGVKLQLNTSQRVPEKPGPH
jgi:hypothetical protein